MKNGPFLLVLRLRLFSPLRKAKKNHHYCDYIRCYGATRDCRSDVWPPLSAVPLTVRKVRRKIFTLFFLL